jgi:hypothetical protein
MPKKDLGAFEVSTGSNDDQRWFIKLFDEAFSAGGV